MEEGPSHLRGLRRLGEEAYRIPMASWQERNLQDGTHQQDSTNTPFLFLVTVIVGLICLFYAICTFQFVRIVICKRICNRNRVVEEPVDTVLVHEGRVFNLTGDQRRAVLETIFSEASKAVTEDDVIKNRRKKSQQNVPTDVEIPGVSSCGTDASMETHLSTTGADNIQETREDDASRDGSELSDELNLINGSRAPFPSIDEDEGTSQPKDTLPRHIAVVTPPPMETTPDSGETPAAPFESPTPKDIVSRHDDLTPRMKPNSHHNPNRSADTVETLPNEKSPLYSDEDAKGFHTPKAGFPLVKADTEARSDLVFPELDRNSRLVTPENNQDDRGELRRETPDQEPTLPPNQLAANVAALSAPIPLARRDSFATVASEYTFGDDDSTGEYVCSICLGGYKEGDILIAAKYCTHVYHKDCIFEWLEKHDECPICRTGMVTDSEVSRAATSLVGKTRMYRAVASYQASPSSHRSPPTSPVRTQPSPFNGTMRRVVSRYHPAQMG